MTSLILLSSIGGCNKKLFFKKSTVVPSAQGNIVIKTDKKNNYVIDINVTHLILPEKLHSPKKSYVIWMETEDSGIRNIGQLNSSDSHQTTLINESLSTVTTLKPVGFFITAEKDGTIQYPGPQVVLKTEEVK